MLLGVLVVIGMYIRAQSHWLLHFPWETYHRGFYIHFSSKMFWFFAFLQIELVSCRNFYVKMQILRDAILFTIMFTGIDIILLTHAWLMDFSSYPQGEQNKYQTAFICSLWKLIKFGKHGHTWVPLSFITDLWWRKTTGMCFFHLAIWSMYVSFTGFDYARLCFVQLQHQAKTYKFLGTGACFTFVCSCYFTPLSCDLTSASVMPFRFCSLQQLCFGFRGN